MKKMKRFLAFGLVALMMFATVGCGDKNSGTEKTDGNGEKFPKVDPYTNAEVQDLGGYEFTIAAMFQYYEDPTGMDLIVSEQAWQDRREEVEDLYNCKITVVPYPENF